MRELLRADDRIRRFLRPKRRRRAARRVRVAALVDELDAELVRDLRDRIGRAWRSRRIILRSGTPLRLEHLRRVDFARASAILVPASVFGAGADATDTRTIKVLLSIAQSAPDDPDTPFPFVVAELLDPRRLPAAYGAYGAPMEAISSDLVIGRMLAQGLRHPHLSYVFEEMLQHGEGNELHVADPDELVGRRVHELHDAFPRAVVLGLVRPAARGFEPLLDPADDRAVAEGDRIVLLAMDTDDASPSELPGSSGGGSSAESPASPAHVSDGVPAQSRGASSAESTSPAEGTDRGLRPLRRILLLGWSHRIPAFLEELDDFTRERFRVDIAAQVDLAHRRHALEGRAPRSGRVEVHQWETDYTVPAELAALEPARYDNIVIVASDWLPSGEEADARAIVAHVLVHQTLARGETEPRPHVLVELTDPANRHLVAPAADEVIVSPLVVSHMLAQIALRRELRAVFDELFGSGGAEIFLRPASDYGLHGRTARFRELQQAATAHAEVALGLRRAHDGGGLYLNPDRDAAWKLRADDEIIVLSQY